MCMCVEGCVCARARINIYKDLLYRKNVKQEVISIKVFRNPLKARLKMST